MLEVIILLIISFFFLLFPIFFLPVTSDTHEFNKLALLILITILLLFFSSIKIAKSKKLLFSLGSFGIPYLLLIFFVLGSTFLQSPNLAVSFITPLASSTIIAGFFLYLFLLNSTKTFSLLPKTDHLYILKKAWSPDYAEKNNTSRALHFIQMQWPTNILVFSADLLSLSVFLSLFQILPQNLLTPAGTTLSCAIFLAAISLYLGSKITLSFLSHKFNLHRPYLVIYSFSFLLISSATIILALKLISSQKPVILPWYYGWLIFIETLPNFKTLLFGIGPANFLTAFTLAKPAGINSTSFWNVFFITSSSFLLTLATETGLAAGLIFLSIILKTFKMIFSSFDKKINILQTKLPYLLPLFFLLIAQTLFPSGMSVFILTVIFLSFAAEEKPSFAINLEKISYSFFLLPVFSLIFIAPIFYFGGRFYLAEVSYKKSLDALAKNNGREVYNLQLSAIRLNPYLDRYHRAFSQTNLGIANSLAAKKELSDNDKQTIPRLIQQGIDEGRTAVSLYRTNILNWDNLANIYASLINFAEGAKDWAKKSYEQKIVLDPVSPLSYFAYGRFYLNLKEYQEAEKLFNKALELKPDFANARYYLSFALREQKNYQEAYRQLSSTLTLLPQGSDDANKVEKELAELSKLLSEKEAATPSSQFTPSQLQNLDTNLPSPYVFENLPTPLPTISL